MNDPKKDQCDLCRHQTFRFLFNHHHNWKVEQCSSCGLTQIIPRPTRREVEQLYENDESHFDPYIDQRTVHEAYFREELIKIMEIIHSDSKTTKQKMSFSSLLDIGCLTGVLLGEAAKMGIDATGVDISLDAVRYCKKQGYKAFHGTIKEYAKKFPKKRYDVISAFEIIEHEYSPLTLAKTMYAMLRTGGVAVATTPNHGGNWRKMMGKYWPGYTHTEHLYFFDLDSLKKVFEEAGFSSVDVRHDTSRPFPLSFLFTRGADYVPFGKGILRFIGSMLKPLPLKNPINPWDDIIVTAVK